MKSKKGFVFSTIAVILFFTAGFSARAQELKFDGYINSGFGIEANDVEKDPTLMIYGVDSERNIGRFRLNGAFTNEAKNAGANFRLQVQGRGFDNTGGGLAVNTPSLAFGYGWVKPVEMLNIKFGFVDDSTFAAGDYFLADDQGEGLGVLVRVSPVTGLDIGVGAYVGGFESGGSNNIIPARVDERTIMEDAKYTFNVGYTMEKTFRVMASYRTENKTAPAAAQTAQFLAEFRLLLVKDLTAVFAAQLNNLTEDFSDEGFVNFFQTVGYKMDDLSFGLNAAQYLDNSKKDPSLNFNLWLAYALSENQFVPRLDLNFFAGGIQNGTNYHRKAWTANYAGDDYVFSARPSFKINLDSRNSLEIGDAIYYQESGGDTKFTNVFYLDFVVRF